MQETRPAAWRALLEVLGVSSVALAAYFVVPLDHRLNGLLLAATVLAAAGSLVPLSLRRARQVLTSDRPLVVAGQSICSAVTLLVVSFSAAYYVLGTGDGRQIDGIETKVDGLYFSVTILSTVGFGDVTAVGQTGRAVVTANMIVNLVLVAIAIRIVSWALDQREASAGRGPAATARQPVPPSDR